TQFVVGEEGPVPGEVLSPAEAGEAADVPGGQDYFAAGGADALPGPHPGDPGHSFLAHPLQLDSDFRHVVAVQVAPAVPPRRGHGFPAEVTAGKSGLYCFGEAGFPGSVAAHDHGEAGAGREFEGGGAADATEALDTDSPEIAVPEVPRLRRRRSG